MNIQQNHDNCWSKEKLQYDIKREASKISASSSGKINQYEYLTGEEILPSDQKQIIEEAKCTYSALGRAIQLKTKEKNKLMQLKTIGNRQLNVMKLLKMILIMTEMMYRMTNKMKHAISIQFKRSCEFDDMREKFNINKLIYNFKTKEKVSKDFRNYQVSLNYLGI